MALLNIGEDPWLLELESCEKLHRDIMEQLSFRSRETRSSESYARVSATVRMRLKQYNNEVEQLKVKLQEAAKSMLITSDETERRSRKIEILLSKGIQMQRLFDDQVSNAPSDRSLLMGNSEWASRREVGVHGPPLESVDEIRSEQKRMLGEQEEGLENLSKIISRQKNIAQTISNEVDLHNEILDDLDEHVDRTNTRVRDETRNITVIDNKDKTCVYWVIIILLFISIIVVVAI